MAQYACTKCMQWFKFDQLSKEDQLCLVCVSTKSSDEPDPSIKNMTGGSMKESRRPVCKFCKTDVATKTKICERCLKNYNEHGEPRICKHCSLQSAFIGSKCQRCASSQKKYGSPVKCHKCDKLAAFDHSKARIDGQVLCWLCYITMQKKMKRAKRKSGHKTDSESHSKVQKYCPNDPYIRREVSSPEDISEPRLDLSPEEVWKELLGEGKGTKVDASSKPILENKTKNSSPSNRLNVRSKEKILRKRAQENSRKERYGQLQEDSSLHTSLDVRLSKFKKNLSAPSSPVNLSPSFSSKKTETKTSSNRSTPRNDGASSDVKSDTEAATTPGSSTALSDRIRNGAPLDSISVIPPVNDGNIVIVSKLREEISSLKKQLAKKDQQLIEKDKQVSMLKVGHLTEIRALQAKVKSNEEDYFRNMENYRNRNQELLKKIAQISKGKA